MYPLHDGDELSIAGPCRVPRLKPLPLRWILLVWILPCPCTSMARPLSSSPTPVSSNALVARKRGELVAVVRG